MVDTRWARLTQDHTSCKAFPSSHWKCRWWASGCMVWHRVLSNLVQLRLEIAAINRRACQLSTFRYIYYHRCENWLRRPWFAPLDLQSLCPCCIAWTTESGRPDTAPVWRTKHARQIFTNSSTNPHRQPRGQRQCTFGTGYFMSDGCSGDGHRQLGRPASVRPIQSPRLKPRKQKTGTKSFVAYDPVLFDWMFAATAGNTWYDRTTCKHRITRR